MIGPARFAHIETCAREVCRDFKIKDELDDTLRALRTLDADLATHRATLAALSEAAKPPADSADPPGEASAGADGSAEEPLLGKRKRPAAEASNYADLLASKDVKKARRLLTARENAIKSVKALIKRKTYEEGPADTLAADADKVSDNTVRESPTRT
jgi:hypothetical protein